MKLIISGGLGHLGSRLLHQVDFINKFSEVLIIDNLITQRFISLFNLTKNVQIKFIQKDIRDVLIGELGSNADPSIFLHLAALTDPASLQGADEKVRSYNLEGTKSAATLSKAIGAKLIFTSSTNIYSGIEGKVSEDMQIVKTNTTYSEVKLLEERFILEADIPDFTILRLGTISGISPGMRFHTAVNKFCFDAVTKKTINVWDGALKLQRPYLSLDDLYFALAHIIDNKLPSTIFNLVTKHLTVSEIVEMINQNLDTKVEIIRSPSPYNSERNFEVDTSKIRGTGFVFNGDINLDIRNTLNLLGGISV
jgi:UDP-glucose 4-epimerase